MEVGDRVQTIGGFVGTVSRRSDDLVTIRTEGGHELDFIPSAIARKIVPTVTEDTTPQEGETI